ncbi:MAG: peptidoglycan-binding protein [Proteobacteria bacterium]|nr:peptidoglycan-binding protein [Pseudomonadota bacterium]
MTRRLSHLFLASTAATFLLLAGARSAGAQSTDSQITNGPPPSVQLPPLPPAAGKDATQNDAAPQQQQTAPSSSSSTLPALPGANPPAASASPPVQASNGLPSVPFGRDGVREVQRQLIALGFNPGPADGLEGPATVAAARRYNEKRGGSGSVPVDGALLDRLQKDTAPRLSPEQVNARAQPARYQAQAPARAPADPVTNAVQQLETGVRGLFNGGN